MGAVCCLVYEMARHVDVLRVSRKVAGVDMIEENEVDVIKNLVCVLKCLRDCTSCIGRVGWTCFRFCRHSSERRRDDSRIFG